MKIVGLSVDLLYDGEKEITIRARVAANEELEEGDLTFLVGNLNELAGMGDTQRLKGGTEGEQTSNAPSAGRRARRSGGAPSVEQGQTAEAEAPTTGRRSRRGSAENAEAQSEPTSSSGSSAEPASEGRRSRRPRGESAANPPTETGAPSADGRARRTSRSAPPAGEKTSATTTSPSDRRIEDADLSKAATIAARVILPKGVMAILDDFGAKQSSDVPQEFRVQFLDALDEAVAKASKQ